MPGYRLVQLLGRGGFGEVWRCEAPGGLQKAVKFVSGGGEQFRQELGAFEEVKGIRHPYLLMLERVELLNGELVMVMELADCQIYDRFKTCQAKGLQGIPRDELLGYLEEAAEALDMMSSRHGLQHLDVKPENLFLVSDHMKVGDYGLVRRRIPKKGSAEQAHGFTPRYSSPEVLNGWIDTRSDQYSLALVYFELLTGKFPYLEQSVEQVMSQHLNAAPNLAALPRRDRESVGRALAKDPVERYPTCTAFVRAIRAASGLVDESEEGEDVIAEELLEITPAPEPALNTSTLPNRGPRSVKEALAPTCQTPSPVAPPNPLRRKPDRKATPQEAPPEKKFDPVVNLDLLHGLKDDSAQRATMTQIEFISELLTAAQKQVPFLHELSAYPEDSLTCSFLCTLPAALVPFKLRLVAERWGFLLNADDPKRFVMRKERGRTSRSDPRPTALEVIVYRPLPSSAEYIVIGTWTGAMDAEGLPRAQEELTGLMEQLRGDLQNLEERRRHPRYPFDAPVLVFPQYSDGVVDQPIPGVCRDICQGGVRFLASKPVRTDRAYIEFKGIESVLRVAILVKLARTTYEADGALTVARFRM
ncbi:MAG TPA: serine/threonine-protein kinase [Urbifossiella sp.]|nr:serine/threonine-protein kinase [Urbifossiella sp.]